jgi:hypothetical protein
VFKDLIKLEIAYYRAFIFKKVLQLLEVFKTYFLNGPFLGYRVPLQMVQSYCFEKQSFTALDREPITPVT